MNDAVPLDPQIRIIIDQLGDPYVWLNIQMPMEAAMSADQCDQLALKILAASAAARARAAVTRKQLFAGTPAQEAIAFTRDLLDE